MTTSSTRRHRFPTLRYAAAPWRWAIRTRRRQAILASASLAIIAAPLLWWSIQLTGLPDIGDPFDVAAFRAYRIPDDRNAFVLYRQAAERLKPLFARGQPKDERAVPDALWSKAHPTVRGWLEANREVMELYRRGTERSDALPADGPASDRPYELFDALKMFRSLALLEASRLEDAGDMAGAWVWYRAALRSASHIGMHGTSFERRIASSARQGIHKRLAPWAADTRTTPAMLRRAIDETIADDALSPSDVDTLKADYQSVEKYVGDPQHGIARGGLVWEIQGIHPFSSSYQINEELAGTIADAWRCWRREEERSRRVFRLVVANWLAYEGLPPGRRPPPGAGLSGPFDFYAFGPEAPSQAHALSPGAIERWLMTTSDALAILQDWKLGNVRPREQATRRALFVLLAGQLYRRDHGTDPPADEALVGPYLKELPGVGSGDPTGAKTPDPSTEQGRSQ